MIIEVLNIPIPSPRSGESEQAFVSRCISAVTHADPNRDKKQIQAICYDKYRRRKKITIKFKVK